MEDTAFAPASSLSKAKPATGAKMSKKRLFHQITGGLLSVESDVKGSKRLLKGDISRGNMAASKVKIGGGSLAGSKAKHAPLAVLNRSNNPSSSEPQSPQQHQHPNKASSSLDETKELEQIGTGESDKLAAVSITAV